MDRNERLQQLIRSNRLRELKADLASWNPADVASFLEQLDGERRLLVFRVLPKDLAAAAFAYLPPEMEEQIVSAISDAEVGQVMDRLFTDDAVNSRRYRQTSSCARCAAWTRTRASASPASSTTPRTPPGA